MSCSDSSCKNYLSFSFWIDNPYSHDKYNKRLKKILYSLYINNQIEAKDN